MANPQTVVITGAGQGLGLGIARRFAQAGAHVVVAELNPEAGRRAAQVLTAEGCSAQFEPLDVRDPQQSAALVEKLANERGGIDVWINNAGIFAPGPRRRRLRRRPARRLEGDPVCLGMPGAGEPGVFRPGLGPSP